MALCSCKDDGQFLVRIKLRLTADDTWTVNRIIYRADEKQIQYYKSKAHPEGRRRKRRSKKATAAHSHS